MIANTTLGSVRWRMIQHLGQVVVSASWFFEHLLQRDAPQEFIAGPDASQAKHFYTRNVTLRTAASARPNTAIMQTLQNTAMQLIHGLAKVSEDAVRLHPIFPSALPGLLEKPSQPAI